jgi:competence protein ComEC
MEGWDRKGGGLVSDTLEIGPVVEPEIGRPAAPVRAVRPVRPELRARLSGIVDSVRTALAERRLFILLPFAMVAGVIVCVALPADPSPLALETVPVALAIGLLFARRSLSLVRLAALCGAFWAGLCLLPIHGVLFGTTMLSRPAYGFYQGRVDEVLDATSAAQRVVLSEVAPTGGDRAVPVRRARVLIKGGPELAPGDVVAGRFRFAPVPGPVLPGGYDTQFHSYFDGIGAYGNAIGAPTLAASGPQTSPERLINAIRTDIASRIDASLAEPAAGVARAIISGDQSAVGDDVRTTMATAGIAHVLSVSGLHLTIVAGGVFWVLRLLLAGFDGLSNRVPVKRISAVGGIVAALFYFSISGGNVAAFRSTLMILLVFGAVLVGRRALTMRNVAIAGIIVTGMDPASVFRPSYQLSFAAVVALVGAYESLRSRGGRDASFLRHAWDYTKGIVVTSLVAGAATLLFSIYHFQQTSPLGVLGNLATLPLVGFVMMPAAALAVLAMPLGIERPFLLALGWSIDRMLDMAHVVAAWSEHLRAAPLLTPAALLIGLAALCWFAFFRDRWRLLGPGLAVPLVLIFAIDRAPDVLVSDTTRALAVRGVDGLDLADGKPDSFALNVWRDTYAEPIATAASESCDSLACVGTSAAGFRYAIVRDPAAFADECGRADLIVARVAAPVWCTSSAIVDPQTLARRGVQWLRWDKSQSRFEIRGAIGEPNRPWRIRP